MHFFQEASRIVPVITAMAGACISGATAWVALKGELSELRRQNEHVEAKLENHLADFDHNSWFSDDWIRHPALRGCLERWLAREQREEDTTIHGGFERKDAADIKWQRFYELNPSIVRPGNHQ